MSRPIDDITLAVHLDFGIDGYQRNTNIKFGSFETILAFSIIILGNQYILKAQRNIKMKEFLRIESS